MTAREIVQEFCDLMTKRDPEAVRPYLADDVVYQNVGMPPTAGVDAVVENLAGQMAMFPDSYRYETVNSVSDGDLVMNERLDHVRDPQGREHALPVMGTFVVRDGRIARWTDYWDSGLIAKMMSGEDYATLLPAY